MGVEPHRSLTASRLPEARLLLLDVLLVVLLGVPPLHRGNNVGGDSPVLAHDVGTRLQGDLHLLLRGWPDGRLVLGLGLVLGAVLLPEDLQDLLVADDAGVVLQLYIRTSRQQSDGDKNTRMASSESQSPGKSKTRLNQVMWSFPCN